MNSKRRVHFASLCLKSFFFLTPAQVRKKSVPPHICKDTVWDDQHSLSWLMRWIQHGQRSRLNVFVRQACSPIFFPFFFFLQAVPRGGLADCLIESSTYGASPFAARPLPEWDERGGELQLWCFCSSQHHGRLWGASLQLVDWWMERHTITTESWIHSPKNPEAENWCFRLYNTINF